MFFLAETTVSGVMPEASPDPHSTLRDHNHSVYADIQLRKSNVKAGMAIPTQVCQSIYARMDVKKIKLAQRPSTPSIKAIEVSPSTQRTMTGRAEGK